MPSRRHELLARLVPKLRKSRELDSIGGRAGPAREVARDPRPWLPDRRGPAVRQAVRRGPRGAARPASRRTRVTQRGRTPSRTVVYLHGGGFVAPIDPYQVRYAARLASGLGARVVMPDYPLTPEHTWRDSHEPIVDLVERLLTSSEDVTIAGDSAGGGLALAVALTLRDRGGPQPSHLLLISPWVDLTISTPETHEVT